LGNDWGLFAQEEGFSILNYTPQYERCYLFNDSGVELHPSRQSIQLNATGQYEKAYSLAAYSYYAYELDSSVYNKGKKQNAIDAIIHEAKKYRIVFINENHEQPQNRMFTWLLLDSLRKIGFNYFGAEGIEYLDSLTLVKHIPNPAGGAYLAEVTYGEMIRKATKLGFNIFKYDVSSDTTFYKRWDTLSNGNIKMSYRSSSMGNGYQVYTAKGEMTADSRFNFEKRDSFMAWHIEQILRSDSTAKLIVHVGFGHHQEDETFMGSILKNSLKEDFLTIDQTSYLEPPDTFKNNTYNSLLDSVPVTYQFANGKYLQAWPNSIDLFLVMPRVSYSHSKPNWRLWDTSKRVIPLPEVSSKITKTPAIVRLYDATEFSIAGQKATPIDVTYFETKKDINENWFCINPELEHVAIIGYPDNRSEQIRIKKRPK
jgi:hypothetical protein